MLQFDVPRTANAITLETFFATGKQSPEVAHVVLGVYVALYNGLKLWRIIEITPVTVKSWDERQMSFYAFWTGYRTGQLAEGQVFPLGHL